MCVLWVATRVRADAPLVLLANRDEAYDRAFAPPARRPDLPGVLAPRDLLAGGTWLGAHDAGLVVALTNRGTPPPRPDARSRGLLVADTLRHGARADAEAWLRGHLAATPYAPFHLLVADRAGAFVVRHTGAGAAPAFVPLPPGVHVLTNLHELDEVPAPAPTRPVPGEPLDALRARLEAFAADRETPLPGGHRVDKVGRTRGTVCSATVVVPADPRARPRMRFAAGPPHEAPFADVEAAPAAGPDEAPPG